MNNSEKDYWKIMKTPPNNEMLCNKTVLVTGGGSGIGKECARRFFQAGANVIIAGRNEEKLEKAALENWGGGNFLEMDISDIDLQENKLIKVEQLLGKNIDILVNNAGVISDGEIKGVDFLGISEKDWDVAIGTNMKGTYFMCQNYVKRCIKNKSCGKIINICSITGMHPRSKPYPISKNGMIYFTRALSPMIAKYGVTINGIAPGLTSTELVSNLMHDINNIYRDDHPDKRAATPDDIANIALFLASDYSAHISGDIIVCDGGKLYE